MAKSYPRRDSASGIWRVTDIADNLQKYGTWPTSAGTRALFHGGSTPSYVNTIDYVTIASTGDAADFGDMTHVRIYPGHGGNGNFTRSFMIGGEGPAPSVRDTIDYINPISTGDAADFYNKIKDDPKWADFTSTELKKEASKMAGVANAVKGGMDVMEAMKLFGVTTLGGGILLDWLQGEPQDVGPESQTLPIGVPHQGILNPQLQYAQGGVMD